MNSFRHVGWFLSIWLSTSWAASICAQPAITNQNRLKVRDTIVISVGVTEYQDLEQTYAKYLDFFQELTSQYKKRVKKELLDFEFQLAVGSYEEVKDWYNTNRIDVAILSAMPVAELLSSALTSPGSNLRATIEASYLGTLTPIPENSAFDHCADGQQRRPIYNEIYSEEEKQKYKAAENFYRTIYIAPKGSPIDSVSKLKEHAGKIKFLFVRPLSVSGYVLPAYTLRTRPPNIDFTTQDYEFTYQHSNTLRKLQDAKDGKDEKGKYLVGFVQDNVRFCAKPDQPLPFQRVRLVDDEKLMRVPAESVLVNYHLDEARRKRVSEVMTDVLAGWKEEPASFFRLRPKTSPGSDYETWLGSFLEVRRGVQTVSKPASFSHRFTLDQIIKDLELYQAAYENDKKTHSGSSKMRPLRLALVLSGGGAKCAYQAGAISVLENKLKQAQGRGKNLDINLVVGTSGGAINALFVAMGASRPENAGHFLQMWGNFSQEDFFRPSAAFNIIFGLCFGFGQALLFIVATLLFGRDLVSWNLLGKCLVALILIEGGLAIYFNQFSILSERASLLILVQVIVIYAIAAIVRLVRRGVPNWWRQAGWLMVFVSLIEIAINLSSPHHLPPTLAGYHFVLHVWAMMKLFSVWSAPFPLLLGLAMLVSGYRKVPELDFDRYRAYLLRTLSVGVVVGVGMFLMYSLFKAASPTYATGIEGKFLAELPALGNRIGHPINPGLVIRTDSALEEISKQIHPGRDLVITASRLPMDVRHGDLDSGTMATKEGTLTANELPNDLYFYHNATAPIGSVRTAPLPPLGTQFISLEKNKEKLLDIVIGSGTIYPLFPYRTVHNVQVDERKVSSIDIIDGGFIHNVPVDAAIKWGATHIILIEASPVDKPFAPHHFVDNVMVAFNYLFAQAQRIDADKGTTEIFALRPSNECEKLSKVHRCNNISQPDMDTFDFDPAILAQAITTGHNDMESKLAPLTRRAGEPLFRDPIRAPVVGR